MLRKNTIVFWKNKNTEATSNSIKLMTPIDADEFSSSNNRTDPYWIYKAVTFTDEQLKSISNEKSDKIKEDISLEQFNPFSTKVIKYKKDLELFKTQKEAFAQGLFLGDRKNLGGQKNVSPLKSALAQSTLFHSTVIEQELFSFLEPADPFKPKTPSTAKK